MRQKLFSTFLFLYCCTLNNTCGHQHHDTATPASTVTRGFSSSIFKIILSYQDVH